MKDLNELEQALKNITIVGGCVNFREIGRALLCDCVIVKGRTEYRIREIEFYLFRPDYQDYVTYPRTCNAGDWFFHNSGVDIAFQSKSSTPKADPKTDCFGGVLIRTVECIKGKNEKRLFDGPIKVVNELFDQFSAIEPSRDAPRLEFRMNCFPDEDRKPELRYNIPALSKFDNRFIKRFVGNYEPDISKVQEECRYYSVDGAVGIKKRSSYYDLINAKR
ncbi:MAG: hypothetical protein MJY96_00370 [Bacteroidaceae bacterium]|nr:hypothetical protein [Bacteroidaceae bacterium]